MPSILSAQTGLTWTNFSEPKPEELAELVRATDVSVLDAEFIAQGNHRPEITVRGNYLIILVRVPVFNKHTRVTSAAPLYFIIRDNQLWTVHDIPIVVLEKLIQSYQETPDFMEEYFSDGSLSLALHIINHLYSTAFRKLERLSKHITIAEDAVFHGNERKMVEEISILIRDVIDFRKIIRPQTSLFKKPPSHKFVTTELNSQWRRLHGQTYKLWDFLESLLENTTQLNDTNVNLLQHKENELLRLLTYYSIIAIPISILATSFSPRGPDSLPLDKIIFWGMLGTLVLVLLLILFQFKKRRVL